MASTNKTRNLKLTHFVESDTPSWLTDYNNDMQKIDDSTIDMQDKIGETEANVNSILNGTTQLKALNGIKSKIISLATNASTWSGHFMWSWLSPNASIKNCVILDIIDESGKFRSRNLGAALDCHSDPEKITVNGLDMLWNGNGHGTVSYFKIIYALYE